MRQLPLEVPADRLAAFCRRHGIAQLSLFGSVLRDDFGPASEVDVLGELFGREVDLSTPGFLSPHFRGKVREEAEVQYDLVD